eukprot:c3188_g1_i2.p1 GENE.c3188_g1_i2~~c3188_g1_i2.p1  ORF type:complete len:308 (+),score=78.10 c3188_g1_i2:56-979(+)
MKPIHEPPPPREGEGCGFTRAATRAATRATFTVSTPPPASPAPNRAAVLNDLPTHTTFSELNLEYTLIDVNGEDCPPPIQSFANPTLALHQNLLANVTRRNHWPTHMQMYVIPIILAQRDLMMCTEICSGKAVAFLVPLLELLIRSKSREQPSRKFDSSNSQRKATPTALVLVPNREHAVNIHHEALKFAERSSIRSAVVYSESDIRSRNSALQQGCDLLIATPRRLVNLIEGNRVSLENTRFLVLDSLDRMVDMGFESQIHSILQSNMPVNGRQTWMFSGTFPKEVQKFASDYLYRYIFLVVRRVR